MSHKAQKRGASPAQKPVATPSTPKSPNRVSPSSSVPYIVRFIGGAGVSGGSGSALLIPKDIPISVLDAIRLVKGNKGRRVGLA